MLACTHAASTVRGTVAYDYAESIRVAEIDGPVDMRSALAGCVERWRPEHRAARDHVFRTIAERHYLQSDADVLMEVGNSGSSLYGYSLLHRGQFIVGLIPPDTRQPLGSSPEMHEEVSTYSGAVDRSRGSASVVAADGDCYFLLKRHAGLLRAVAVYVRDPDDPELNRAITGMRRRAEFAR